MLIWGEVVLSVCFLGDQERHVEAGVNLNQLGLNQMKKSDLVWDEESLEIGKYKGLVRV